MCGKAELTIVAPQGVDVNGPIRGLSRNELIERIPSDPLHIMVMFGDLPHHLT